MGVGNSTIGVLVGMASDVEEDCMVIVADDVDVLVALAVTKKQKLLIYIN